MKIIFLDIDGVLCTWDSLSLPRRTKSFARFCKSSVAKLNEITDSTGAVIVLTSSWRRRIPSASLALGCHIALEGVTAQIIGQTPRLQARVWKDADGHTHNGVPRGAEIQSWLDENDDVSIESFVIIDDDSDMIHLSDRLVCVKNGMETGLRAEHVEQAISLLSGKHRI